MTGDEALPWPLHSVFLPGLDNENSQSAPGELGWPRRGARSYHEPCQGASPAGHLRFAPATAIHHRQPPQTPVQLPAAVIRRYSSISNAIPISIFFSAPVPGWHQHARAHTGPPQPMRICDGDAVLQAWLFMESKAEPDAENLHFMGNFSIYFILVLEKTLKRSQPLLLLVSYGEAQGV